MSQRVRKSPVARGTHYIKKIKIAGFDTEIIVGPRACPKTWKGHLAEVTSECERLYQMALHEFYERESGNIEKDTASGDPSPHSETIVPASGPDSAASVAQDSEMCDESCDPWINDLI
jgi:hypothetical protein